MGTELALYWSLLSVYTSSVMSAYFLPLRGVLGAGDGGRLWPSRSSAGSLPVPLALLLELSPAMMLHVVSGRMSASERWVAECADFALRLICSGGPVRSVCNCRQVARSRQNEY